MKLLASLIFFTRLPFWKIADVPPAYFKRVVDYWPFVGWLTGGIMAGTLWITAEFLPVQTAVLLALAVRLLVTGALHEDGWADFCDGFGGGTSRDKILSIMKDSHIGNETFRQSVENKSGYIVFAEIKKSLHNGTD